ncbi:hypothetical protein KW799_02585, partial [Candidatus Parcubacteria bacterium]|nr:hypothetical protein [Candidatus Parcubacteria bacterium]
VLQYVYGYRRRPFAVLGQRIERRIGEHDEMPRPAIVADVFLFEAIIVRIEERYAVAAGYIALRCFRLEIRCAGRIKLI